MSKQYDVVYPVDQGEGKKPKWVNCGAVIQTSKGPRLKLDAIPLNCNGWFQLFEPRPKEERPQQAGSRDGFEDAEIPF